MDKKFLAVAEVKEGESPIWIKTPYSTVEEWEGRIRPYGGLIREAYNAPNIKKYRFVRKGEKDRIFLVQHHDDA